MRKDLLSMTLLPLLLVSCSCSQSPSKPAASATRSAVPATAASSLPAIAGASTGDAAAGDASSTAPAGPDQVLRINVRDRGGKGPVYHAGLNLAGAKSLQWTDRAGRHEWSGGIPVSGAIEVRCPALRAETGRKIATVAYAMQGPLTEVAASIDTAACVEPPEKSTAGDFKGTFFPYFGHGAFIPCAGLPANAAFYGNVKAAWVNLDASATGQYGTLRDAAAIAADSQKPVHVEWTGTLIGPGGYGEQGAFAYRLEATAVTALSADFPQDCPAASLP